MIKAPLITGKTPNKKRDELFEQSRSGQSKSVVLQANFPIDLPDANIGIQVSGLVHGKKKRNGLDEYSVLKQKKPGFIPLCSGTKEQEFAMKRQLLTEQGYRYAIEDTAAHN